MALIRFNIQAAIPDTPENRKRFSAARPWLLTLKEKCVIINEGMPNEENITKFSYHICHHDTGEKCGEEREI